MDKFEKPRSTYFAKEDRKKLSGILKSKTDSWYKSLARNEYLKKIEKSWSYYYGMFGGNGSGHEMSFGGEQGEIVNISFNQYRNIAENIKVLVASNRPAFQARAVNDDYKSRVQTRLANGLLEFYLREKRLEKHFNTALEMAIILGSGFIKMDWNSMSGEVYDFNEELQTPIYEGDVEFTNISPLDVYFDTNSGNTDLDWVIIRSWKNRYDLAAKFEEHTNKILALHTKGEDDLYRSTGFNTDSSDLVAVYEFYHKRSESMPNGRYFVYLDDEIDLIDAPLPYRKIPLYRLAPATVMGTAFGYTNMFDLMQIQDAYNTCHTIAMTNISAFGVQNLWSKTGNRLNVNNLQGGLNLIESDEKPEALQLTATPGEVYNYMGMLERLMETLSGVNSVARGNPELTTKSSGAALALIQSMALQFISGLQNSYIMMMEDLGTGLINMLQDYASVPRVAAIAGIDNRTYMKSFTGQELSTINRVIVDVGNPLSQNTAGRLQMADSLLQMGAIKTPETYFQVLTTGRIDSMVDPEFKMLNLVKLENEALFEGKEVRAVATDRHSVHIQQHNFVLSDPELRLDDALAARVLAHISEHLDLLRNTDPGLLALIGEQPIGPNAQAPVQPQDINQPQQEITEPMEAAPAGLDMPNMPNIPEAPPIP